MSISVPPHTESYEDAVTYGYHGARTDPYPDTFYVPGIQADPDLSPTVTMVVPATGLEAGNEAITLNGSLLVEPVVTFGGNAATVTNVATGNTQITVLSPPGVAGPVDVVVTTPGGTATVAGGFTYTAPPPPEDEAPEQ